MKDRNRKEELKEKMDETIGQRREQAGLGMGRERENYRAIRQTERQIERKK